MIKTIDHFVASSLKEFLNFRTLTDLRAFKTVTGELFPYTDRKWSEKSPIGSSYSQWVYDSGIAGTTVPTSLSGVSGSIPDYKNGRFLVPTGTLVGYLTDNNGDFILDSNNDPISAGISSVFSVNEINYYISSSPESKLIFETNYLQNPDRRAATGYIEPYSFVAPCVFVKSFKTDSKEYCLGGGVESNWNFKIIAMTRTESQLLGIQKIVRNSRQEVFPLLTGTVLNQYNNLATPGWTYQGEIDAMEDYCFVDEATFRIQELDVFTDDFPQMFVGIGNIEVSYFSYPRVAAPATDLTGDYITDSDGDYITDSNGDPIPINLGHFATDSDGDLIVDESGDSIPIVLGDVEILTDSIGSAIVDSSNNSIQINL